MKTTIVTLIMFGFTFSACNEDLKVEEISSQDEIELIALKAEMTSAALYNDSLANYINLTGINNDSQCIYFDDHYHNHDSLYTMHHDNYSHSYSWDDHTMGNGGMMMGHTGMTGTAPHGMGHAQSEHNFMDSLHNAHQQYHPGIQ